MNETWHGTDAGYTWHRCRCDDCRSAHSAAVMVQQTKRRIRMLGGTAAARSDARSQPREHGTLSTYNNWRCRCAACCAADSAYKAERRLARKAKSPN